jgi:CRISPR-associated endoribonuclease Cas6
LLLGELFPLLYSTLLQTSKQASGSGKQPFLRLGKQLFLLEEVISSPEDRSRCCGYTSFGELVARVRDLSLKPVETLKLDFTALTTFHRSKAGNSYGKHFALLPFPQYVFAWLARRWQELAPPDMAELVQLDQIEPYIEEEGIVIDDHMLATHRVQFIHHPQRGFLGTCTYSLRGPDEEGLAPGQLSVRKQLILLSWLAFYTGVGYKTTMGMGQTRTI